MSILTCLGFLLSGCQPGGQSEMPITLIVDGQTREISVADTPIVSDVLQREGVVLGTLDRVNPPPYNRVTNGMTITVVRVVEETLVQQEIVPFGSRTMINDGLPAGETRLLQQGANGVAEVTYRVVKEDGIEISRVEVRRYLLTPPQDEIIAIGSQEDLTTVTMPGTLAYISSGNAWIIRQNSANRIALTLDGGLDEKVFELSEDGRRLLFTRSADSTSDEEEFNTLWAILDTTDPQAGPVQLDLSNILFADWVPGTRRTIIYSTAEPRDSFPGWQANNDLWRAQISPTGALLERELLLEPSSGGVYGWYGTVFAISPVDMTIAWAQPDAVGILIPEFNTGTGSSESATEEPAENPGDSGLPSAYTRRTLATFAPWNAYDFVWIPSPAWSSDGRLFAAVLHGPPIGAETPEDSPVFSVVVFSGTGNYQVTLVEQAGMWALPQYSLASVSAEPESSPLLLYLQANDPLDSVFSWYRMVVVDADGSNGQIVYPYLDKPGLQPQTLCWSPDGNHVALIDPGPTGNLFIVDVITGLAQRITSDGLSSSPRWAP
nr:G5 domain-containing protein [Anaerolineae bacterium]